MKLLYFSQAYTSHDHRFLEAFADAGIETHYLRLTGEVLERRPFPAGVHPISWIGDTLPYCYEEDQRQRLDALRVVLEELLPDVVLAGPIQSCTRLMSDSGFQPFVAMSWGSDLLVDAAPGAPGEEEARRILAQADAGFGDCQQVADAFGRLTDLAKNRIVIFPWGIDTEKFSPDAGRAPYRNWPGWDQAEVVISLRSWEPIYAINVLVDAFTEVHRTHPSARLLLAGDGSQKDTIIDLIEKNGLSDVVAAPGRIPNLDLPAWLASADLYVSSALSDGSSISLLEAMGCGLPVVATRDYGNLEWVEQAVNGWLVSSGSPLLLAKAIMGALVSQPDQLAIMGKRNRTKVKQHAGWSANVGGLVSLLSEVL
jgi:L-malate glycosyltransferase